MTETPIPPDLPHGQRGRQASVFLVAFAAIAAYAATAGYEFVWDDTLLIQQSWRLHHWRELPSLLTSHFWAEVGEASHYYRPLVTLTFFMDVQIWGLRPFGFHLTNVLAHVAVTVSVLVLARRVTGDSVAAVICTLAFALHPVHVESVTFVSGRTDVVAALFFVLALLAHDHGRERGGWGPVAWSLGAYFLALLAKEVAIALPVVLLVWDRLIRGAALDGRGLRRALPLLAAYGAVTGLYLGLRIQALGGLVDPDAAAWGPLLSRVLTAIRIAAGYAWVTIVPYPTSAFRAVVPDTAPPDLTWWLAAAGMAAALTGAVWVARHVPVAGFGALWFWITLGPSIAANLLPLPSPMMAERFLYLPTVGFCLILGWTASRLLDGAVPGSAGQVRPMPALGLAVVLLAYGVLTMWGNEDWRDEVRLYSRMVERSPGAAVPRVDLGLTQLSRGEVGPASEHLREAVRLAPGNARALAGLGLAETVLGDRETGLRHGLRARELAPENADVRASLGALFLHRGEPTRAVPELTESLRLKPHQVHAALNRALALAWLGDGPAAEAQLDRALALARVISPDLPLADRITAEVMAGRDPVRARAAWEQYVSRLQATGRLDPALVAELARAERRLGRGGCGDGLGRIADRAEADRPAGCP